MKRREKSITEVMAEQNARAVEAWPIVRPYLEGFADRTHSGTRNGPVHLFGKPFERPLCRRKVRQWNFEGTTEFDFCPKCLRIAKAQHGTRNAGYDPDNE